MTTVLTRPTGLEMLRGYLTSGVFWFYATMIALELTLLGGYMRHRAELATWGQPFFAACQMPNGISQTWTGHDIARATTVAYDQMIETSGDCWAVWVKPAAPSVRKRGR